MVKSRSMVIIAIFLVAFIAIVATTSIESERSFFKINSADEEVAFNAITIDGEWSEFTYENAPNFVCQEFLGKKTYSYSLDTIASEQYSMRAHLSTKVDAYYGGYTLGFYYFSRQSADMPNYLTVQISDDDLNYRTISKIACVDNGYDIDSWNRAEVEINDGFKYIRFIFDVCYTDDGTGANTKKGLYLNVDEITLETVDVSIADAEFSLDAEEILYYNGKGQIPTYEITTLSKNYGHRAWVQLGEEVVEAVNVGNYVLYVEIFNSANKVYKTLTSNFIIKPQTINITNPKVISNGTYAVLLDVTLVDGVGRKVDLAETGIKTVYDATKEVIISVQNENFAEKELNLGVVKTDVEAPYIFSIKNTSPEYTYDGVVKGIGEEIVAFTSYDFDTDEYVEYSGTVAVTYTINGEEVTPIDAGEYDYSVSYGRSSYQGVMKILPKELEYAEYVGEKSLDKVFDGTDGVAYDGIIGKEIPIEEFTIESVITGDEVTLTYSSLAYARNVGHTYLLFNNGAILGADSNNYTLSKNFYVKARAYVSPTTLTLKDDTVLIKDKIYNGGVDAEIGNDDNDIISAVGLCGEEVLYGDLTAVFNEVNCGLQTVEFTISNKALYDRFIPTVQTANGVKGNILPYELVVNVSSVSNTDKEFDEDVIATPIIEEIVIAGCPDFGDGLESLVLGGDYIVEYESARYDSVNKGERTISLTNLRLKGYDLTSNSVFSNYIIKQAVVDGEIIAKKLNVLSEYVRIYEGEALPNVKTDATDDDVISTAIYVNVSDAIAKVNQISNNKITKGEYVIRVDCISENYLLGEDGYVIIPLEVTVINQLAEQKIYVSNVDTISDYVKMISGGVLKVNAISITQKDGVWYDTGLTPTITVIGEAGKYENGVITAVAEGSFTVKISQNGNENYKKADDVTLNVNVISSAVTVNVSALNEEFFVGDYLPNVSDKVTYSVNSIPIDGVLRIKEGVVLTEGINTYQYYFDASENYTQYIYDANISGNAYELVSDKYVLTTDVEYVSGKEYYRLTGTPKVVQDGESVVDGVYELSEGVFILTSDTVYDGDKTYYTVEGTLDTTQKIDGEFYYKNNDEYIRVEDDEFSKDKEYYYKTKYFYGEIAVAIRLNAVKRVLTITLDGAVSKGYGESYDFLGTIKSIALQGVSVEYDKYVKQLTSSAFVLNKNSEVVQVEDFECGTYEIGTQATDEYCLSYGNGHDVYSIVIEGAVELTVNKKHVSVKIEDLEKYYYQDMPTIEQWQEKIIFDGEMIDDEKQSVVESIEITVGIDKNSAPADYIIKLDGIKETDNYTINYVNGYASVLPLELEVYATTRGHVYGQNTSAINIEIMVHNSDVFTEADLAYVKDYVRERVSTEIEVDATTDVGSYPIEYRYDFDNKAFSLTFRQAFYKVMPAEFTDITFADKSVLYDGKRHSMEVTYNAEQWKDIEIEYDNDYFIEPGDYVFTATISQKNYRDLVLVANLIIGTLTISSNNYVDNYVSLTISDSNCTTGVSTHYSLTLAKQSETAQQSIEIIKKDLTDYEIIGTYDVEVGFGTEKVLLPYNKYTVSLSPKGITKEDNLKIYGYANGVYGEIEYVYDDGNFIVETESLKGITFVKVIEKEINKPFIWIGVAIFAILILIVISIMAGNGKKAKRERLRSRRRHNRWA